MSPHEPDRGLRQPPAEEEEQDTGAAEGEGVVLHRHHQAQAQRRQRAHVVGEAVQASQLLAVSDQADLGGAQIWYLMKIEDIFIIRLKRI